MDEKLSDQKIVQEDEKKELYAEISAQEQLLRKAETAASEKSQIVESDNEAVKATIKRFKESQISESAPKSKAPDQELPQVKFPSYKKGLLWVFCFSLFLLFLPRNPTLQLMMHLPMHIFWTACFYRLCQICDRAFETKTKPAFVALLSILAFLCSPVFPAPPFPRMMDPFFMLWAATQVSACWYLGSKINKGTDQFLNKASRKDWNFRLTFIGCGYLLIGFWSPALFNLEPLFGFLWFVSQFGCFLYASQTLKTELSDHALDLSATDKKEQAFIEGENLELRYRSFAGIERWLAQRFSTAGMKQGLKLFLMWVLGPALVIVGVIITRVLWFSSVAPGLNKNLETAGNLAASSSGAPVQIYLFAFLFSVFAIFWTVLTMYRKSPTHLILSAKGLRFAWKHKNSRPVSGPLFSWSKLQNIRIERPKGKTSTLHDQLVFESADSGNLKIKLNSLDSFEDKEWILKAIKAWAPAVKRDASVFQSLSAPADYSYTELWLQALSAPPQRERLKPLVSGLKLKQGKYRVCDLLGVGGQGQAYIAEEAFSGQSLVLKEFILPVFVDISVRKSALEQFENEARILRQLQHPQIVKLLDYFVEDHRAYLVLEHIDGASLKELVEKQGPLPEPQVKALAEQMCKILSYLHNLAPPVVHRDFTPDNLILSMDGTLKLIDFNVAQEQESTTIGTVVGKHAYLPPEQFRGLPTCQSDIFALGATLHYLLTGEDPEPISVSHPAKANPKVSQELDSIVAKATAPDQKKRFQNIEELSSAFGF